MLLLKQPLILPFFCHKSVTTCQIDSYKVSNYTLKPNLCSCVKTEMSESTAHPQQPFKRGTNFFGHCVEARSLNPIHLGQMLPEAIFAVILFDGMYILDVSKTLSRILFT